MHQQPPHSLFLRKSLSKSPQVLDDNSFVEYLGGSEVMRPETGPISYLNITDTTQADSDHIC